MPDITDDNYDDVDIESYDGYSRCDSVNGKRRNKKMEKKDRDRLKKSRKESWLYEDYDD